MINVTLITALLMLDASLNLSTVTIIILAQSTLATLKLAVLLNPSKIITITNVSPGVVKLLMA
jgi:hypothetical protein